MTYKIEKLLLHYKKQLENTDRDIHFHRYILDRGKSYQKLVNERNNFTVFINDLQEILDLESQKNMSQNDSDFLILTISDRIKNNIDIIQYADGREPILNIENCMEIIKNDFNEYLISKK